MLADAAAKVQGEKHTFVDKESGEQHATYK
jgi:hypothetical protein